MLMCLALPFSATSLPSAAALPQATMGSHVAPLFSSIPVKAGELKLSGCEALLPRQSFGTGLKNVSRFGRRRMTCRASSDQHGEQHGHAVIHHAEVLHDSFNRSEFSPIALLALGQIVLEGSAGAGAARAEAGEEAGSTSGPIELGREVDLWEVPKVGPLQTGASVVLTAAITVLAVRAFRRRSKLMKESRIRADAVEARLDPRGVERRKAAAKAASEAAEKSPPTPQATLAGALVAGTLSVLMYKFTISVEEGLSRQTISDVYTVRQITITVRTIVNGILYLATFVLGANGLGLFLYGLQLLFGGGETAPTAPTSQTSTTTPPTPAPKEGEEQVSKK